MRLERVVRFVLLQGGFDPLEKGVAALPVAVYLGGVDAVLQQVPEPHGPAIHPLR